VVINNQNLSRLRGEDENPLKIKLEEKKENKKRAVTENNKATTPPNLLGMERKIAYANKKYHSGWI
jgi:hypothetical protein